MRPLVVTFDFDSTLSETHVQAYAKELINSGIDVWVVTARYDDLHTHHYGGIWGDNPNYDLWEVVDSLEIPRWKVRFMNMIPKYVYLQGINAIWHLDDDTTELFGIKNSKIKTKGIQVKSGSWKSKCNRLLTIAKNKMK